MLLLLALRLVFVWCGRQPERKQAKQQRALEERKSSFADLKRMGSLAEIKRQTGGREPVSPLSPSAFTMPNPWLRAGAGTAKASPAAGAKDPATAAPHRGSFLAYFQRRPPAAPVHTAGEAKSSWEPPAAPQSIDEGTLEAMIDRIEAGAGAGGGDGSDAEVSTDEYTSEEEEEQEEDGQAHFSEEHVAELMEAARKRGSEIVEL